MGLVLLPNDHFGSSRNLCISRTCNRNNAGEGRRLNLLHENKAPRILIWGALFFSSKYTKDLLIRAHINSFRKS